MTTISEKKNNHTKLLFLYVWIESFYPHSSVWVVIKTQIQQIFLSKTGTVSLDQNELPSKK